MSVWKGSSSSICCTFWKNKAAIVRYLFEFVVYDANHHIIPIYSGCYVGSECEDIWKVFKYVANKEGFDFPSRITVDNQEKIINSSVKPVIQKSQLFLDMLHVKKKSFAIGNEKKKCLNLHEPAICALVRFIVDSLRIQYGSSKFRTSLALKIKNNFIVPFQYHKIWE